jgi:hypothetical protein
MDAESIYIPDPRVLPRRSPAKTLDQGDLLEFSMTPGPPSVLILSQKSHRDWQALALTGQAWVPAQAAAINDIFQGVLMPQDTQRVRLEFKPFTRYAWLAHVFWVCLAVCLGFRAFRKSRLNMKGE